MKVRVWVAGVVAAGLLGGCGSAPQQGREASGAPAPSSSTVLAPEPSASSTPAAGLLGGPEISAAQQARAQRQKFVTDLVLNELNRLYRVHTYKANGTGAALSAEEAAKAKGANFAPGYVYVPSWSWEGFDGWESMRERNLVVSLVSAADVTEAGAPDDTPELQVRSLEITIKGVPADADDGLLYEGDLPGTVEARFVVNVQGRVEYNRYRIAHMQELS